MAGKLPAAAPVGYAGSMAVSDLDILRTARVLLTTRTPAAAICYAATRLDELNAAGDRDGAAVWRRVLAALRELQRTGREGGESLQ